MYAQVCRAAPTCKLFSQLASQPLLWRALLQRQADTVPKLPKLQANQDSVVSLRQACHAAHSLTRLQFAAWEKLGPSVVGDVAVADPRA